MTDSLDRELTALLGKHAESARVSPDAWQRTRGRLRRGSRRKVVRALSGATFLVLAGVALFLATRSDENKPTATSIAPRRGYWSDPEAFRGFGLLATWTDGRLHVIDGRRGVDHDLSRLGNFEHRSVELSPTGDWLAYGTSDRSEVWIVRPDGRDARRIETGVRTAWGGWSPTRDEFALRTDTGILLGRPAGATRTLVATSGVGRPAWSTDGSEIAYTVTRGSQDQLFTVPVSGGEPRRVPVDLPQEADIELTGWWADNRGLLFLTGAGRSASIAADGLPLMSVPRAGGTPRELGGTLNGTTWVSWAPDQRMLALVDGGGREAWSNKRLRVCDITTSKCSTLEDEEHVALAPAWAPDGTAILYVRGREAGPTYSPPKEGGFGTHEIWSVAPSGSGRRLVSAKIPQPVALKWSLDGQHVLVLAVRGIWVLDVRSGDARQVVQLDKPLAEGYAGSYSYYGLVEIDRVLSWRDDH